IIGEEGFRFLPEEYGMPAVIGGFEPDEILLAVYLLLKQIAENRPRVQNAYPRAVRPEGNRMAQKALQDAFRPVPSRWRGLGEIPDSGLALREELADLDAGIRFGIVPGTAKLQSGCRCGDVICGKLRPKDCPLFGKLCTPEDPVGPCMVSSEGACAAAYKYE
ncbi:MAG: hydrogenase formation protein HypD, partial [Oscillospiraceae bacterium]|nr:hydrogenase formation protein HypD [Oscillospiraceae bacterium]